MLSGATLMRKLSKLDPAVQEVILLLWEDIERHRAQLEQQVTQTEFRELTAIVAELAEAQKRSEERLTRLEIAVAELTEAQKRTEERLNELAEAQKRTEERLNELAEAQKRTEERLNELAEAQKRTEERLNELAEAQKRTEEELQKLAGTQRLMHERLEGLSNTVGYTLEDRALRALPGLLRQHGIQVEGRLTRRYVVVRGRERQVNIYGHGRRGDEAVLILGEAKVRPSRKEIDRFVRLARQLEAQEQRPAVLLFVAYDFPPRIEAYLRERAILPVWSYELDA